MASENVEKATFGKSLIERVAERLDIDLAQSNEEIITALKERYGRRNSGMHSFDIGIDCSPRGVRYADGKSEVREYTWAGFVKALRVAMEASTAMVSGTAPTADMSASTDAALRTVEAQIGVYMRGAYANMIEVGRCLARAKEEKLVPHGEWEAWVQRNTGFSVRQAQRLMQAARAVPEGSAMAALPISKIQLLMALPEEERESAAEKAVQENATIRELRRQVAEAQQRIKDAEAGKEAFQQKLTDDYSRKVEQVRTQLDQAIHMRTDAENRVRQLEQALETASQSAASSAISAEAQAQIDRLKQELEDAEAYAAEQARARKAAQEELLNASIGRDAEAEHHRFNAADLDAAVRVFLGDAGILVHMGAELSRLDNATRSDMLRQVERVACWTIEARKALNTQVIEGGELDG